MQLLNLYLWKWHKLKNKAKILKKKHAYYYYNLKWKHIVKRIENENTYKEKKIYFKSINTHVKILRKMFLWECSGMKVALTLNWLVLLFGFFLKFCAGFIVWVVWEQTLIVFIQNGDHSRIHVLLNSYSSYLKQNFI